jgi:dTDP-4-dehydrorhamnose 3,5-epimerase
VRGAVLDVVVDLRVGSESFGAWEFVQLDDEEHRAVYLAEGLGHGFVSLTDDAMLHYCVSAGYDPQHEHTVHPLDPDLGIEWPVEVPILSARDEAAPSLAEALESDLLPRYEECIAYTSSLSG